MNEKNLKVGLTVFIGLVIFFLFIFFVGSSVNYFASSYELKLFVQDVQGLSEGSMVSLGGIKIGTVKKIEFQTKNNLSGIDIRLEILSKYQNQITDKSKAEIKTIGLLGDKFVDIKLVAGKGRQLENGDYIDFTLSPTISDISQKLAPSITDFVNVMKNLRIISDSISNGEGIVGQFINSPKMSNNIKNIISELNLFTSSLNSKKGTLGKLAYSDSVYNELASLSRNFNLIGQSIVDGKGSLGKLVTTDSLYTSLNELISKLNMIGDKLNADSSIAGGFINSEKMYSNLKKLINDLDSLTVDLKKNPGRYIQFSVF